MKKSKLSVIVILTLMLVMLLIPMEASAATKKSTVNLSKTCTTLYAGNKLPGINGNTQVTWANRILPFADKVVVTVPYCTVEKTKVTIKIKSNNGKTYSASKTFPTQNTQAKLTVYGATGYNTKSIKVTIYGKDKVTGKSSTWTIVNK